MNSTNTNINISEDEEALEKENAELAVRKYLKQKKNEYETKTQKKNKQTWIEQRRQW